MTAGSGPPSPRRLATWTHDPGCSCSRTSPGCLLSTAGQPYPRSSDRWPNWGMWDATGFTALPTPAPPTSAGAGSSLLPTPRASDGPHGGPQQTGTGLAPVIRKLFPTPRVQTGGGAGAEEKLGGYRPSGAKRAKNVATVVTQLFPTPNATDYKGVGQPPGRIRHGRPRPASDADLPTAVSQLFPTPAARDWKGTSLRGMGTIRSDTGKPRTARQVDLPAALEDLTGRTPMRLLPTPHGFGNDAHGNELTMVVKTIAGASDTDRTRRKHRLPRSTGRSTPPPSPGGS